MQTSKVLHYAASPTRAGWVLVLMSACGVVDVVLASEQLSAGDRSRLLASRFPDTRFIPDDGARGSWAAAVVARVNGAREDFVVPLDFDWAACDARRPHAEPVECRRAS